MRTKTSTVKNNQEEYRQVSPTLALISFPLRKASPSQTLGKVKLSGGTGSSGLYSWLLTVVLCGATQWFVFV